MAESTATVVWQFQVKASPGAPITEVPVWGDKLEVDLSLEPTITNLKFALDTAQFVGKQFIELYLLANGADAGPGRIGLAKYCVNVTIEEKA